MIHVQKHGMGAFENHALAFAGILQKQECRVVHERGKATAEIAILLENLFPIGRPKIVQGAQNLVPFRHHVADALLELWFVQKIGDAEGGGSLHFVGIGGPDAAARRADRCPLGTLLAGGILLHVIRHHQMRFVTDAEIGWCDGDSACGQIIDFAEQRRRVEHDAVADDVHLARPKHADGKQMGGIFLAADADGVSGVGAAAVADDHIGPLGQQIDDLSLSLVTPLQPDDARILLLRGNHGSLPFR